MIEDACAGDRRRRGRRPSGRYRRDRLLLVLPEQEPRRVRRRRARHHARRRAGRSAASAARARRADEVPPLDRRRQLPARRAAGGGAHREARPPGRVDRGAPAERGTLSRAVRRRRVAAGRVTLQRPLAQPDAAGVLVLPVERAGRAAHLQPVRHPRRTARRAEGAPRLARDRHRGLLSGAVSSAGVLRARWGIDRGDFPVAEACAGDSLALPIFAELTEAQQRYVVDEIVSFLAA